MDSVFWSTFWGGLASLAAFAVVSAAFVWVVGKITSPLRKRPAWKIESDSAGNSHIVFMRRKQGRHATVQYWYRGDYMDMDNVGEYPKKYTEITYITPGLKFYLPTEQAWDEVRVNWLEGTEYGIAAQKPHPNEGRDVFVEYTSKIPWRHRLFVRQHRM